MDTGYSTVRNLLFVVLVMVILAILSNFYVAQQFARIHEDLASLRELLAKELMGSALTQSQELQKRMDALNESAAGIDAKLKKAQDDFVARMNVELPRIMDNYARSRAPRIEGQVAREMERRGVQVPTKP